MYALEELLQATDAQIGGVAVNALHLVVVEAFDVARADL